MCDDGLNRPRHRHGDPQGRPNEHITCTYTNTKLGKIIVEKQTSPDGAAGSFAFTGDAAGSIGDGGQIVVDDLLPGTYTSTEGDPTPPFDLGSIACDDGNSTGNVGTLTATFHLEAGETVKCTFTNIKRGTITIIKDAIPNDPQDFGFTTTGSGLSPFSLDDDNDATLRRRRRSPTSPRRLLCHRGRRGRLGTDGSRLQRHDQRLDRREERLDRQHHLKAGGSVTCTYTNTKAGRIIVDKVTNPAGDPATSSSTRATATTSP